MNFSWMLGSPRSSHDRIVELRLKSSTDRSCGGVTHAIHAKTKEQERKTSISSKITVDQC